MTHLPDLLPLPFNDPQPVTFRVLVADDDEWTRNLLRTYLTSEGVDVEMARNGKEAMVRFLHTQPDVVFLDVEMPGSTGLEVLALIREQHPDTSVIIRLNRGICAVSDGGRGREQLPGGGMKACILAGGKGTRFRPITETIPKPMIPIINKPVMEFLIDHLRQHGFDQILVTTSYLASEIENYFREGSRFGVQIGYSFEGYYSDGTVVPEGLGSAGGLKKVQEFSGFFDETFLVLCGDAIIDLDLTRALDLHRRNGALATIVLKDVPREQVIKYGVVETEPDGRIIQFQEKPSPRYQDTVIREIFSRMDELDAAGVQGMIWRMLADDPKFNTANYHGMAERHWGLLRADGSKKPAFEPFLNGMLTEADSQTPQAAPATATQARR